MEQQEDKVGSADIQAVHTEAQTTDTAFDFDTVVDRRQSQSMKWRLYGDDVLPMWVADMDFASPPAVIEALRERVRHGIFGYESSSLELKELITDRLAHLYSWHVTPDAIVFVPGVVTGFNVAIRAFVGVDESVAIQTPVYGPILHAAQGANVHSQAMGLIREPDGRYSVDIDCFAETVTDHTRLFLLCNPHNPVGRVLTREELLPMAEVCLRHDTIICSDEIHCDLVFDGHRHLPIASLAPEIEARSITLMAPSKTFNIAGLHCGFAIIPNADLRRAYNRGRDGLVGSPNLLGYVAAQAAYAGGQPWLDALLRYLQANRDLTVSYVTQHMPQLRITSPEATYLAWIDCSGAALPQSPKAYFLERGRVAFNDGTDFGPDCDGFIRLNFGCPRRLLLEGLERMRSALAAV